MGKYGFSVFVGNLSRRVRRDDLKDTFRDMGRIIEVDIKTGYAFIEFEERRDAEDACKELNGIKMEGERISVEMSKVRSFFTRDSHKKLVLGLPR
jgi:RNA recognition motif-containing protein